MKNIIITTTKLAHFAGNDKGFKGSMCFDTAIMKDKKGNVYETSWGLNINRAFVDAHPKRLFVVKGKMYGGNYEIVLKKSLSRKANY